MTSTAWRPPILRGTAEGLEERPVSWTELFYDLVFVVAVAHVSERFLHHPSTGAAIEYIALFGMLWWAWASFTFLVDRYHTDDALHRLLAGAQMLALAGMAAAVALEDESFEAISVPIALAYTGTRVVLVAMYARVWWHIADSRPLVGGYLRGFGVDTVLWIASIFVPAPARYALWGLAMAISLATPWLMRRAQVRSPLSASHLPERFGLFIILVLGESFAAVVAGLHEQHAAVGAVAAGAAGLLIALGLWWVYFDNFEGSVVRRDASRVHDWRPTTWIYAHYPLAMTLTLVGGGMHALIGHMAQHVEALALFIPGLSVALSLLWMGIILACTTGMPGGDVRRRRALFRFAGAASVLVIVLLGGGLSPGWYLGALAVAVGAQVLLDTLDDLWRNREGALAVPADERAPV